VPGANEERNDLNIRQNLALPSVQTLTQLAANAAILALWLWLFHPVYPYLGIIFTHQEFRTNQVVLLAVLALAIFQVRRGDFRPRLAEQPQFYPPALNLAFGGAILFLLSEHFLDINTLSATLFGLASYGLVGLWLRPAYWRAGMPVALLLVGALPFGEHLDTFVGYPLRIATARAVSQGLAGLGVRNLGVDTILIFENGVSQVDSPCSGVKSLWTGALFLLSATWIERRPLNRRWLLAALSFGVLLLAANLARVAILVLVGQVASWRLLAQMLHVPLGVVGFVAACAAALAMLRWAGSRPAPAPEEPGETQLTPARPAWLAPGLVLALLGLALLYSPNPQPANAAALPAWDFPAELQASDWPLTSTELNWLTRRGAETTVKAARWRFASGDLQGSLLFVTSETWRAQHRPERCFTVYGLEVQASQPLLVAGDFPLRWLTLGRRNDPAIYSAAYWLQSADRITEDYAARIWDDLAPQPQPWVLVTVLFDRPVDLHGETAQELFTQLRRVVQASLETPGSDAP
jgi:exosortase O